MSFRKTYQEALQSYKPLSRTTPLSRAGFKSKPVSTSEEGNTLQEQKAGKGKYLQRPARLKPGKKTRAWENERRKLKVRFAKVGITSCELRGVIEHDCKYDDYLSFAHSTKRNDPRFNISEVILACIPGHTILDEKMSHAQMFETVKAVIARREIQP